MPISSGRSSAAAAIVNIRRILPAKFQIKGVIILHVREQVVKRATLLKIAEHIFAQCSLIQAPHLSLSSKEYCFDKNKTILLFFQVLKNIFLFLVDIINQSIYNPNMFTDN